MPEEGRQIDDGGIVLDTSVLIDGRILDFINCGFLADSLLVPEAVINELNLLADGRDAYKRQRARNGLDILTVIGQSSDIKIILIKSESEEADAAVVEVAKAHSARIFTTDYALLKRAEIAGLKTVNLHKLLEILQKQPAVGETVVVYIEKAGETNTQGVGHTADGTLCVVEGAAQKINQSVEARIKKVSQKATGRMIFAQIIDR